MNMLINISPKLIAPSLTNPRKTFDATKLAELAESIRTSGLHSPVLLRPLPPSRLEDTFRNRGDDNPLPTYELVTGERRLRASLQAGMAEIPALVRELTDPEVIEIQVIENLQRDDLTALEEAEGYEHLMKANSLSADEVAERIGKSRSYVYSRLKLLDLCTEARDAVRAGQLDASKALLLARVPTHKLQLRGLKEFVHQDHQGDTMSARAAASWLRNNLMLRLETAVFDIKDAKLLPEAGACAQCPKRTGANPELFSDVDSADVCTDTTCFHDKVEAHTQQIIEKAKKRGQTVIDGEEAKKIKPYPVANYLNGYSRLDETITSDAENPTTLRQQLKADEIKKHTVLLIDPHSKTPIELVPDAVAEPVYQRMREKSAKQVSPEQRAKEQERDLQRKKDKLELKYHEAWRGAAVDAIEPRLEAGEVTRFETGMLKALLFHWLMEEMDTDKLQTMLQVQDVEWYERDQALKAIREWDGSVGVALLQLCLDAERSPAYEWNNGARVYSLDSPMIEACAERLAIDLEAIRAEVREQMRGAFAEVEQPATPIPSAAPAKKSGKGKPEKAKAGGKIKAAPAAKMTAQEAEQGIAAAMQGVDGAADDGRADTDTSETAEARPVWPFPKLSHEGAAAA